MTANRSGHEQQSCRLNGLEPGTLERSETLESKVFCHHLQNNNVAPQHMRAPQSSDLKTQGRMSLPTVVGGSVTMSQDTGGGRNGILLARTVGDNHLQRNFLKEGRLRHGESLNTILAFLKKK